MSSQASSRLRVDCVTLARAAFGSRRRAGRAIGAICWCCSSTQLSGVEHGLRSTPREPKHPSSAAQTLQSGWLRLQRPTQRCSRSPKQQPLPSLAPNQHTVARHDVRRNLVCNRMHKDSAQGMASFQRWIPGHPGPCRRPLLDEQPAQQEQLFAKPKADTAADRHQLDEITRDQIGRAFASPRLHLAMRRQSTLTIEPLDCSQATTDCSNHAVPSQCETV